MAHYAFLDTNSLVVEVITGRDEWEVVDGISDWEDYYGNIRGLTCKRTSYNGKIRKNYASVGFRYDETLDAFIPPQPFDSWTLNEEDVQWYPPVPMPQDENLYTWNEETTSWDVVNVSEDS